LAELQGFSEKNHYAYVDAEFFGKIISHE